MQVITAPEPIPPEGIPAVFLAGGVTNCPLWQDEIIEILDRKSREREMEDFIVLNPRRKNFPIHDPNAAKEQITWEFRAIERAEVFSMWFCNSPSDQPICMYELGRNLVCKLWVCIGIEPGYRRENDVRIQTKLARPEVATFFNPTLGSHVEYILTLVEHILSQKKEKT